MHRVGSVSGSPEDRVERREHAKTLNRCPNPPMGPMEPQRHRATDGGKHAQWTDVGSREAADGADPARPRRAGRGAGRGRHRDPDPHDDHARHHRVRRCVPRERGGGRRVPRGRPGGVVAAEDRLRLHRPVLRLRVDRSRRPCRRRCSRSVRTRPSSSGSTRSAPRATRRRSRAARSCVGYNWNSSTKAFGGTKLGTGWPAAKQNACASGPPDQIGVYIKAKHTAVTRMFGGDRTLTGTTIMRLEPYVGTLACASS